MGSGPLSSHAIDQQREIDRIECASISLPRDEKQFVWESQHSAYNPRYKWIRGNFWQETATGKFFHVRRDGLDPNFYTPDKKKEVTEEEVYRDPLQFRD